MADATPGTSGNPGAPGSPGASGDPGSPGAAPGSGGNPPPASWHGLTDAADVAYIENKGWKGPQDVYKSYRSAETLIGRDPSTLVPIPRADDPAGFRAMMARVGMPEAPDKYEIEIPQGTDPKYGEWAKGTFHKLGLTATQAKELSKANNEFMAAQAAEADKAYNLQVQTDKSALLREWGGGHERMMSAAQTAAKSLGMTGEMIDALEQQMGYAGVMKYLAGLGQKLGEDTFHTGTSKAPGFGMTPQEAKIEYEKAVLDPNFSKALMDSSHPGHKAAKERKQMLFQVMFPQ